MLLPLPRLSKPDRGCGGVISSHHNVVYLLINEVPPLWRLGE
jgi:hypothetical protein